MEQFSVVIPAFNAEVYIVSCINALEIAGFSPKDIYVVDDGSTDNTIDVAEQRGVCVVRNQTNSGAANARNAGAAASDGEALFFVDADVTVHADTREVLVRFFKENPDFAAVFGTYDDDPASPGLVSRARNLFHRFVHLENAGEVESFWTGCGAVSRSAFESIGGFSEKLHAMEDIDLGHRLAKAKHRIWLLPELQGRHHKRWTLIGMAKTDFFDRALPWARLLRGAPTGISDSLNIGIRTRLSVAAVALGACGLLAMVVLPVLGGLVMIAALLALAALNARFLNSMRQLDRWGSVPAALLVLIVHYFCGGLGFALVLLRLDRR